MKHVTMAEKSLLMGDEAADVLVEYAALVAKIASGDHVKLRALGVEGNEVIVTFLLNSGTVMLAETTASTLPEPDNVAVIGYMRGRLESFGSASAAEQAGSRFGLEP